MLDEAVKERILAQMKRQERERKAERATANIMEACHIAVNLITNAQATMKASDWHAVLMHLDMARGNVQYLMNEDQS